SVWRIDDSVEIGDAEHAEVGDGKGAAAHLVWSEFFGAGFSDEGFGFEGDLAEAFGLGIADDGGHEAIFNGHTEGEVDAAVVADGIAEPAAVDKGLADEGLSGGLENEVVDGEFDAALFGGKLAEAGIEGGAQFEEGSCVELNFEIEVRDGGLR